MQMFVFGRTSTGVGQREGGGVEAWHKAAKHALAGKLFFIAAFKICSSSNGSGSLIKISLSIRVCVPA